MPESIISDLQTMIQEEQWTRSTLQNYSTNDFKAVHDLWVKIEQHVENNEELEAEILELLKERLEHNKNNITALYVLANLIMRKHSVNDSYFLALSEVFLEVKRWAVIELVMLQALKYGESRSALHLLAEVYVNLGNTEKEVETWERIIRVDYTEADMVVSLANHYEDAGRIPEAITHYQKAFSRYLGREQVNSIPALWSKLIELSDDTEYLLMQEIKIAKLMSQEKSLALLDELYKALSSQGDWEKSLKVAKRQLELSGKDVKLRKRLVDIYRELYSDKENLEDIIKHSHILQTWQNIIDAISNFEKHISFTKGSFVYHKTWGVGRIAEVEDSEMLVDFVKKRGHRMSLEMAVGALTPLSKDHFWVYKSVFPKDKMKTKVQKDPEGILKILVSSFPQKGISIKEIKEELVPGILTPNEWNTWSPNARKILKTNALFGNFENQPDNYVLREKAVTFDEKLYNRFRNTQNFFTKINLYNEFIEESSLESDCFSDMSNFFMGYLKLDTINEYTLGSYLTISQVNKTHGLPQVELGSFLELFNQLEDPVDCFIRLQDNALRSLFLNAVRQEVEDWDNFYVRVFPQFHTVEMLEALEKDEKLKSFNTIVTNTVNHYKELRDAFIWLAPHLVQERWKAQLTIDTVRIYINSLNLYEITSKEIENRRSISINKRLNKSLKNLLFKDNRLGKAVLAEDAENIVRLYSLIVAIDYIDDAYKKELEAEILELYPKLKIKNAVQVTNPSLSGHAPTSNELLTLNTSLIKKQKELQNLNEVQIPQNSKEIGIARELGDLKENAEYISAKEKQRELTKRLEVLMSEINIAKPLDLDKVDLKRVSFGTKVTITNLDTEVDEVYTLLGPWESDPNNGVISYKSPLATHLLNATVNKKLKFSINKKEFHYKVKSIEKASV